MMNNWLRYQAPQLLAQSLDELSLQHQGKKVFNGHRSATAIAPPANLSMHHQAASEKVLEASHSAGVASTPDA